MGVSDTNGAGSERDSRPEVRLKGHAVSRGVAIGKLIVFHGINRQFYRLEISAGAADAEIKRFRSAIRLAEKQIGRISKAATQPAASAGGILDAQKLMLGDSVFLGEVETAIRTKLVNSEWAVKEVTDAYIGKYRKIADERLSERYIDVEDIRERILAALGGDSHSSSNIAKDKIIAAEELRPSTLAELALRCPTAVATEQGGWTSHSFILAREMNLPSVTGLKRLLRKARTGDMAIVDGYSGLLILHPAPETLAKYKVAAAQFFEIRHNAAEPSPEPARTLDGRQITIRANLDIPSIYQEAVRLGARGIGLYRSEFLFNQFKGFLSEAEQYRAYCAVGDFAGDAGVKIRTFDLSADQFFSHGHARERNPALGLRAVRLSLAQQRHFRTQLRALLRASAGRNIDIVVPMVSGPEEVRRVRELLAAERESLSAKGIEAGNPAVGAMVEVPATILLIEEIVEETDFICLGTNDLVQYMLAADRDNETVSDWFRTLHPAVIRAIRKVIETAHAAAKPLIICGEMAGSPYYVPVLIGLGASELSMNINSIPRVRRVISGISFEEARQFVERIRPCRTPEEVEKALAEQSAKWAHLYGAGMPGLSVPAMK